MPFSLRLGLLWGNLSNQEFLQDIGEDLFEEVDNELNHASSFLTSVWRPPSYCHFPLHTSSGFPMSDFSFETER